MLGQKVQHRPRTHGQLTRFAHIHRMNGLQLAGIEILQHRLQAPCMQIIPGVIERQPRQSRPALAKLAMASPS